jgi:hypothetical protein
MHDMSTWPLNAISNSDPWYVVSAISHLRDAASDMDTALAFTNIVCLFTAGPGRLRDLYRDLDALVAQLDAMRLQFAEFVEAAENDTEPD